MGPIKNLFGVSPEINKTDKNNPAKKVTDRSGTTTGKANQNPGNSASVKTDISQVGREMLSLQLEAASYINEVDQAETISNKKIDEIKGKIASDYYFDPEVIDKIVDKLAALPNFNKFI